MHCLAILPRGLTDCPRYLLEDFRIGYLILATEVVESDFSKGLAEMRAAEQSAVSEHEKLSKANAIERATKEQDVSSVGPTKTMFAFF